MTRKIDEAERLAQVEAEKEAERLAKAEAEKINFVKMKNDKGIVANVHPDEVENYKKGNYVKV